jgi:thiamine biosynthesis lipoprotein
MAMGTRFECVLPVGEHDPSFLRAAAEAIADEILVWHHRLSAFAPDSDVARLRRAAPQPVLLPPETLAVLARCVELSHLTDGRFDPTLAPALAALGLRDAPPNQAALEEVRALVGHGILEVSRTQARLTRAGAALDLGAVGKGIALDAALVLVQELGITDALVHGGTSSVLALGNDGGLPWRVKLGASVLDPVLELSDLSLAVSAHHGRTGPLGGHIIDPRTLRCAERKARAAAVVCASACDADAWSTAVLVDPALADHLPPSMSVFVQWPDESWLVHDSLGVCVSAAPRATAWGASS